MKSIIYSLRISNESLVVPCSVEEIILLTYSAIKIKKNSTQKIKNLAEYINKNEKVDKEKNICIPGSAGGAFWFFIRGICEVSILTVVELSEQWD